MESEGTDDSRYILSVRQQPIAARACGFGERDRRLLDPPPIVQLRLRNFNPGSSADDALLYNTANTVTCVLLSASATNRACDDPASISRRLMGTQMTSPFIARDLEANAEPAVFFIFPDLSCRQNGRYRLQFTLAQQTPPRADVPPIAFDRVESDVFEVFSAKDFPGMRPSTALTIDLNRQGAPLSIKKGRGFRDGLARSASARTSNESRS